MKLKGLINAQQFSQLEYAERQLFLIENNMFEKYNNSNINYEYTQEEINIHSGSDVSKIFGKCMYTTLGDFTINKKILVRIENLIVDQCKSIFEHIFKNQEMYREQFHAYPQEKISELKISTKISNGNSLSQILYYKLNKLNYDDFDTHIDTIKEFSKYEHKFIYDYLTGLNNVSSYFQIHYHTYVLNNLYLNIIEEVEEVNSLTTNVKSSIPKRIALMHDLGMFKTEIFENFSLAQKVKLLAFILNKELTENNKDYLKKNYNVLNEDSKLNPFRSTSIIHKNSILNEVLNG